MTLLQDLAVRPPIEGESLDGYLADITGDNDLYRVQHLSSVAGTTYGHRPNLATMLWQGLPALAKLLDVHVGELELRSYPLDPDDTARRAFFGTTVHRADLRARKRFFAPSALLTSPHHRAMWQLRLPYDWETGELLVSTCAMDWCGKTQRWRHSAGTRYCDSCVSDLAEQHTPSLDGDVLRGYRAAIGLTHTDPAVRAESCSALPDEVAALGPAMAYELLLRLAPVANPNCSWTAAARIWQNEPGEIASGIAGAWDLLASWPEAMNEHLNVSIATSARRHGDGNGGETLRFLKVRDFDHVPEQVRAIIHRFLDSIDTAGPNGAALRARTMTSSEAAKVIGLGTGIVVALRRDGGFRTVGVARGPYLVPAFDRAEVNQVRADMRRRWTLNRCNEKLGIPYYAVEQLAALGHLPLLQHPFFSKHYRQPQTSREAFEALCSRLVNGGCDHLDGAQPIHDLMHVVGARLKPWDAVIDAMLAGRLPYSVADGSEPLFQRINVMRDDILPLLQLQIARLPGSAPLAGSIDQSFAFIDAISKRDAAEVLNLAVRQSTELLKAYPTTPEPIIPLDHILRLSRQFVTSTEIAARLGVPHQTVRSGARTIGIGRLTEAGYERVSEPAIIVAAIKAAEKRNLPVSPVWAHPAWASR